MKSFCTQADATRLPLADDSVDLVFTSPPYASARLYLENGQNLGVSRKPQQWIEWMLEVVTESCRVSRGLVLVNCAGQTKDWNYQPYCEGLLYEWWKRGGRCWRPAYWQRVGIPGSGGKQWLRADVEYVLAFTKCKAAIPWADNTAMGHAPKWGPGGEMSHRVSSGQRVNQWGPVGSEKGMCGRRANGEYKNKSRSLKKFDRMNRMANGEKRAQSYDVPVKANPGCVVKVIVGGGAMGSALAHENEAPFPEKLAEFFIRSWCPPGGIVCDPFSGSGTTIRVAQDNGRIGIGFDLRQSQVELSMRRLAEVRGEKKQKREKPAPKERTLFAEVA